MVNRDEKLYIVATVKGSSVMWVQPNAEAVRDRDGLCRHADAAAIIAQRDARIAEQSREIERLTNALGEIAWSNDSKWKSDRAMNALATYNLQARQPSVDAASALGELLLECISQLEAAGAWELPGKLSALLAQSGSKEAK